jgi:molecular chaperone GrpE
VPNGRPGPGDRAGGAPPADRDATGSAGNAGAPGATGAAGPTPGSGPAAINEILLPDTAALEAERDEYLGALQRLKADFDNYRKRVVRQQEEQSARAAQGLVGKLLPVLDTFDLAQAHLSTEPGAEDNAGEVAALSQARAQLLDVLEKEGLARVDETDVPFDPEVHDAVAHAPAALGEAGSLVDAVLRAGYRWRGQVLRPAMVRVRG